MTTINNQEDFLRALRENPEWRAAVRALILGEEMLDLPAALQRLSDTVDRFVANQNRFNEEMRSFHRDQQTFNEEMRSFHGDQQTFNEEMRSFHGDQQIFNEEMRSFHGEQQAFNEEMRQFSSNALNRFDRMEGDISRLKVDYSLRRMTESAAFIPLDLGMQYERNMTRGELARIAIAAASGQALSSDLKSFRNADLVIVATENGETRYLTVEVSYTADQRDTRRAIRNARILSEHTGHVSRPVIASARNTREVQEEVNAGQVYWHQLPDHDPEDHE